MFKKILAAVTAAIIFLTVLAPSPRASAATSDLNIYDFAVGTGNDNYKLMFDSLAENPTFNPYDTIVFTYNQYVKFFSYSKCRTYKQGDLTYYDVIQSNGSTIPYASTILTSSGVTFINHESQMHNANLTFTFEELKTLDFSYLYSGITLTPSRTRYCHLRVSGSQYSCADDFSVFYTSSNFVYLPTFLDVELPSVDIDTSPVSSPLNIDKDSFVEWIINKNKLPYIYEQSGIEIPASKLSVLVDFYDQQGSSLINFILLWPAWAVKYSFSVADAASQKNLFTALRTLYKQYLWYKNGSVSDDVYGPHLPDFIKPNTNKDDQTLITDTEEDTTDISLLREILRAVLNIPKYIQSSVDQIDTRLDELIYNINLLPDNVAGHAYAAFSSDIKTLISALDNVGGTTNIEIDIPEDKESEVELFFDEWSTKFDTKLDEKIPVASQLSDLFSSDFFEKCGIDVNEDGEVYQYYNAPVQLMNLPAASPGTEVSTAESGEKAAVRSMLLKFDDSDPEYLSDAAFTTDIPEWSVSIGGNKVEIFSFKLYAKYRPQIHALITFVLFVGYLFSLYKSIPKIIGNVSDVQNAFDSYDNSKRGDL